MTYSPGSSGYPPAQSPGSYGASTPSFAKSDSTTGKPQPYLAGAVVVLGLLAYLVSFAKMFTIVLPSGEEVARPGGGFPVAAALLAALLAAAGLLPKAKDYAPVVAAISVLGALILIEKAISATGREWALWVVLACSVLQACAASWALLLDAGVITPPTPRPKYDQYSQYNQYGGYYGQQQHTPYQQHGPQQTGYGSQYGGYSSSPSTGGFGAMGPQTGPQSGPQQSQSAPQQGLSTPPTGFPSYSPPPSGGSGSASQGQNHGESGNSGNQSGQAHDTQGHGQGQQSSPAGPAQT